MREERMRVGGGAAADTHAFFSHPIDDRWLPCLHNHRGAFIDSEFHRLTVAEVQQGFTSYRALAAAASGEMPDAAEREHLRTVLAGSDVPYGLPLRADKVRFRAQVSISIDLQFNATVAEDAFGDDGDHVDALNFGGNDERCGLVVGIRGTRANGSDKRIRPADDVAVPFAIPIEKRADRV